MRYFLICLMPLWIFTLNGCGSILGGTDKAEALSKMTWNYEANALQLSVKTNAALNTYEGKAHSVVIAVVQSAEPASFYSVLQNPDALVKILQTGQPSGKLLQVTRFIAEPGRQAEVLFDRAQDAKYVGFIVGYQAVPLAKTAKLFNLPVKYEDDGWVRDQYVASLALADLQLTLGADSVINASIEARSDSLPEMKGTVPSDENDGLFLLENLQAL